ncbi:MAG: RES family NAD+ phosphorylase [Desulfobacteraceae bacterium]|nr:RES family NAD+ phosphorylase [Desulfobacteraceae bacterium]
MELFAYRVVGKKHIESAFSGEGAKLYGGRWNSTGVPIVYTSDSLALCSLEIFVHLPSYKLLKDFFYIPVSFDSRLVSEAKLLKGWNERPVSKISQFIGDQWVADKNTPVLKVPSVLIPIGFNYLINFNHPDSKEIKKAKPFPLEFDQRLQKE